VIESKRNILFILPNLNGGGAERTTLNIIRGLDSQKFKPLLFLVKNEGVYWAEVPNGVEVIKALQSEERVRFHIFKLFRSLLRAGRQADLLVGGLELNATYLAVLAGLFLGRPVISITHVDIGVYPPARFLFHRLMLKFIYPCLQTVVAVSSGVENSITKLIPKLKGKTKIIYNSVRLDVVRLLAQKPANIPLPHPIVIGVGRLDVQKGFDVLIRAHAKLLSQNIQNSLIILGEGTERANLEGLIHELGLEKTVLIPGFKSNPFSWMAQSDVFVLASRLEGFSMVLIEAMATGLPIISTDCPSGPAELLENGRYGLMVPMDDIGALASAISRVLTDSKLANSLRKAALKRCEDFDKKRIREYEDTFSQLIK